MGAPLSAVFSPSTPEAASKQCTVLSTTRPATLAAMESTAATAATFAISSPITTTARPARLRAATCACAAASAAARTARTARTTANPCCAAISWSTASSAASSAYQIALGIPSPIAATTVPSGAFPVAWPHSSSAVAVSAYPTGLPTTATSSSHKSHYAQCISNFATSFACQCTTTPTMAATTRNVPTTSCRGPSRATAGLASSAVHVTGYNVWLAISPTCSAYCAPARRSTACWYARPFTATSTSRSTAHSHHSTLRLPQCGWQRHEMDCSPANAVYSRARHRGFGKPCVRASQPRPTYRQPLSIRGSNITHEGQGRRRRANR